MLVKTGAERQYEVGSNQPACCSSRPVLASGVAPDKSEQAAKIEAGMPVSGRSIGQVILRKTQLSGKRFG